MQPGRTLAPWDRAEIWSYTNGRPVSTDSIVGTPAVPGQADCANPSPYRREGAALWWEVGGKAAYLVGREGTERLPREKGAHRHCL